MSLYSVRDTQYCLLQYMAVPNYLLQQGGALSQGDFYTKYPQCKEVTNDGATQLACIAASEAQLNMLLQVKHQMSTTIR